MRKLILSVFAFFAIFFLISCNFIHNLSSENIGIDYEKYILNNGLEVILHRDTTNPIVAVSIQYRVGSINEVPGKTGLAHYVEHMLFQRSENLEKGEFVNKLNGFGGWYNGGTGNDHTAYYEVFPGDALEKVLWMEADRMGFMISTVDAQTVENEKTIILDEKRRNIVSAPYGYSYYSIVKNLYPEGHPYNWEVIGETPDIKNIKLADIKSFYKKYYHPGNATLSIAGNFDKEQTKRWVKKYFEEIEGQKMKKKPAVKPVNLTKNITFYIEDRAVISPELQLVFPTVSGYNPDRFALDFLSRLLYPAINESLQKNNLASQVNIYNWSRALAGTFRIQTRAVGNLDLDLLLSAINQGFLNFEKNSITQDDLRRIKNEKAINFYRNNESLFQKATTLATYNLFFNKPDYYLMELEEEKKVSKEDILRVYEKYIKNKYHLTSCIIPMEKIHLAVDGAIEFAIPESERDLSYAKEIFPMTEQTSVKSPSKIDRSIEPSFGASPKVKSPVIWSDTLNNIAVKGIETSDVPLVSFSFIISGGHLSDQEKKAGTAEILAKLLLRGTTNMSALEIKNLTNKLGVSIDINTHDEYIKLSASCLSKDTDQLLSLLLEIMQKPSLTVEDFDKIKKHQLSRVNELHNNANYLAESLFKKLMYEQDHILGFPIIGTPNTIKNITLKDVQLLHNKSFAPNNIQLQVAGHITQRQVMQLLEKYTMDWQLQSLKLPEVRIANIPEKRVYYLNLPSSEKAVIFGGLWISNKKRDYLKTIMGHYCLGENTSSRLFSTLRNEKQYTYDVLSKIERKPNHFIMSAQFDLSASIVDEAFHTFVNIYKTYPENYKLENLEKTKTALQRKLHRKYETTSNLLSLLEEMVLYNIDDNSPVTLTREINRVKLEEIQRYIQEWFNEENMVYIIVSNGNNNN